MSQRVIVGTLPSPERMLFELKQQWDSIESLKQSMRLLPRKKYVKFDYADLCKQQAYIQIEVQRLFN